MLVTVLPQQFQFNEPSLIISISGCEIKIIEEEKYRHERK